MSPMEERIETIADVLTGAAWADGEPAPEVTDYVGRVLLDLLCRQELPNPLRDRIDNFDAAGFDLTGHARELREARPMSPRRLLELCAYVTLSDGELTEAEQAYLRHFNDALGLSPEEFLDRLLSEKGARESFVDIARVPI